MAIGFLGYVLPFGQMSLIYLDIFNITYLKISSLQYPASLRRQGSRTFIYPHFLKFYFKLLPYLYCLTITHLKRRLILIQKMFLALRQLAAPALLC